jgi:hypothetical protein
MQQFHKKCKKRDQAVVEKSKQAGCCTTGRPTIRTISQIAGNKTFVIKNLYICKLVNKINTVKGYG